MFLPAKRPRNKTSSILNRSMILHAKQPKIILKLKIIFFFYVSYWLNRNKHTSTAVLCCYPRSGSTLFLSYLFPSLNIDTHSEILNPMNILLPKKPIKKIEKFIHSYSKISPAKVSVSKIFLFQFNEFSIDIQKLSSQHNTKYIVLYRKDILRQFYSVKVANRAKNWTFDADPNDRNHILDIDPSEFKEYAARVKADYKQFITQLKKYNFPFQLVSYEEISQNTIETYKEVIYPFLEVEYKEPRTRMKKQNTAPTQEVIKNYAEIINSCNSLDLSLEFNNNNEIIEVI